jgi:CheY-like chemotaxis protein
MNHLLIVDDNPIDREMVRGILSQDRNYHVEFASNGLEALEHVEQSTPLAVVTDLQMPEMDGLQLVRALRRSWPTIPVILLTAHGSEDIAVEALVAGAADYVPKRRAASDLLHAVQGVLALASCDQRHDSVTQYLTYKELRYQIDGDPSLIPVLVDQIQQAVANVGVVGQSDRLQLAQCIAQALKNAIVHGAVARGPSESAGPQVRVIVQIVPEQATFTIADSGPGFDTSGVVNPRNSSANLTAGEGRGLTLMQLFMDEIRFNPPGNEVTLVKRRKP